MVYKLNEIADIAAGQGAPQGDCNYNEDGTPFVKAGNLQALTEGADIGRCAQKVSDEVAKAYKLKLYKAGTIVFAKSGMSCLNGYVYVLPIDAYVVNHLACITPRTIDSEFLRYYFLFHKPNQLVKDMAYPSISLSDISNMEISIPEWKKRCSIVDSLRLAERVISLRKQQLNELDNLIKARFVEMFGDPVNNEREWPTQTLDSVCKTIVDCPHSTPSYTNENTGYMCIRTSIVKKNCIQWDKIEYISESEYYQRIQRKRPVKGDIVYTREGAILGIAATIDRECNVALGQRSMLLSPNAAKCLPQFLSVAMNFDSFLKKALRGISGSASPHINVGDIKAFAIILPPLKLQNRFAAFVAQTDKLKVVIQKSLDETQLLFDSLMQEYFG